MIENIHEDTNVNSSNSMGKLAQLTKKQKLFLILTTLTLLVIVLLVFILVLLSKQQERQASTSLEEVQNQIGTSFPIATSFPTQDIELSYTKMLSRYEADEYLTSAINNAYVFTDLDSCTQEITNPNFPELNLKFNSCLWGVKIYDQYGLHKSAMGTVFGTYLKFTSKVINQSVVVSIFQPTVSGYNGPTRCFHDGSILTQLNESIYKYTYTVNYVDQGLDEVTLFLNSNFILFKGEEGFETALDYDLESVSYPIINREDYKFCLPPAMQLYVKTKYVADALEKANLIREFKKETNSYGSLYFTNQDPSYFPEAEELIKGFYIN